MGEQDPQASWVSQGRWSSDAANQPVQSLRTPVMVSGLGSGVTSINVKVTDQLCRSG